MQCRIPPNAFEWNLQTAPTLRNSKILPSRLPMQHEKDLTLNNDLLNIYGNPAYAPQSLKSRFTIEKRIKHGYEQMSTATATYGRQHELPEDIIRTDFSTAKGIYADLVKGSFGPRFWSPVEIAMTMIIFGKTFFPLCASESHKLVGNAISTMHAMKAIFVLFAGCFKRKVQCFEDVFHVALMKRLHMENTNIFVCDEWIVVEPISFNIKDIEISMTLPMPRSIVIHFGNQKTTVETTVDSTINDILSLIGISQDEVFVSWKPAKIRARQTDMKLPDAVVEIHIIEKFHLHCSRASDECKFVQECIRQIQASETFFVSSREPVFYAIKIHLDEKLCMTMQAWTGLKVNAIAEVCGKACSMTIGDVSCIRVSPKMKDPLMSVGWWGLSDTVPCEIYVVTKRQNEHQRYSIMMWDNDRKSPMLGQRIGEATHPGPNKSITIEFRYGNRNCCIVRKDINKRIPKHDILARLRVKGNVCFFWDPIKRERISWDQIESFASSICYVMTTESMTAETNRNSKVSFWDFLPKELPQIKSCKIERNHNFLFGIIHRMSDVEIFNEQFEVIRRNMCEKYAKATNCEPSLQETIQSNNLVKDLIVKLDEPRPKRKDENISEYHQDEKSNEPMNAAGRNKRCCKPKTANHHEFWVHLPIGRHCAVVKAEGCVTLKDLIGQAFLQAKISNHEHISQGCYCTVNAKVCDYQMPIKTIPGKVIRVFLRGLLGGGKEEIQKMTSAKVGEILIHKGFAYQRCCIQSTKDH